jgi:hypothetical protein
LAFAALGNKKHGPRVTVRFLLLPRAEGGQRR